MYLGGGEQWDPNDRIDLEDEGRKPYELNEIFDAINSALGHQINNRVDIAFRPRGMGADDNKATTLSKVAMQIADNNDFRHVESQVTTDGFVQQRGYYELRVDYSDSLYGEIRFGSLDPMDVIPDPDGKEYDPDTWADVIITRWLTLDEIESMYGRKARRKVEENVVDNLGDADFGEDELDGVRRNKFGDENDLNTGAEDGGGDTVLRVRVIDRQHWETAPADVVLYPTGDIRVIENATEAQIQSAVRAGGLIYRRPTRRVRWTVSTYGEVLLHDDWSPYNHFTVIPYFPFFRRGKTRGLVDNAVGAQEMLNKALSQYIHILNTTANSGWLVEQNSLSNMSTDDLEDQGSATGIVIEYKHGTKAPEKIEPNQVPTGVDRLMQLGSEKIRTITGISDAMRGQAQNSNQSGRAIQSLQFGSMLSLAVPLDNLARTRHLLASRMLEMIQQFMDVPQVMRIVDKNVDGSEQTAELKLNWVDEAGEIINDLTVGEYDVVVTEQPSAVTFENSQFEQAMELKKLGAPIPWTYIIRRSSLADKNELVTEIAKAEQQQQNPLDQAKAALAVAQAANAKMTSVKNAMEALFSAMRASQLLRSDPALAGLADQMLLSGGFVDADPAPVVPDASGLPPSAPPPTSTNPLTPDNPTAGVTAGLETAPA
ncbi:MAG TPA: hypothetical protein VGK41_01165 [Solirubrobacterales bacterium]